MRSAALLCALAGAFAAACGPADVTALTEPSPSEAVTPEATPSSERSPRCEADIPFEPTYLPEGFSPEVLPGPFPGGRPADDPSSTGGKPGEEQVIVHYRGSGSRAIEIRRPGTLFSELAQADDAPTIEVLGTTTAGFAPIAPGGDDFIVLFTYPGNAESHDWCALYSLNEYGVSLDELKTVAEGMRLKD